MPMQRDLYPDDWEAIAFATKEAADWRCQECGKQCRRPGERFDTHQRTLTVAHIDSDPSNVSDDNLRALCAPCHLRLDAKMHARNARHTRDARRGQLTMEELWPTT